ncbi:MAG: hypothetical protein E7028_00515 [Planctomycetaceae bacterium]|nr:hypothetical protein [Planctomycetaceae bacterium]
MPETVSEAPSSRMSRLEALRERLANIGYEYENQLGPAERSRIGLFYTPLDIASRVVEKALQPFLFHQDGTPKSYSEILELRIFDPALGSGIFLLEACFQLTRFLDKQGFSSPEIPGMIARNCLFGADIDSQAVQIACDSLREFTDLSKEFLSADPFIPEKNLLCADSLKLFNDKAEYLRSENFPDSKFPQNGFDIVLGNPPFLGGRKIRRVLGDEYFDFLTRQFTQHGSGNADLCVYFFHLAEKILRPGGVCGFIATNTISEGDSRKSGLDVLLAKGARIFSVESFPWTGSAAVHVTAIHLHFPKGTACSTLTPILHGNPVRKIFASLKHLDPQRTAHSFPENENLCYQGCVLAAKGFILTPEETKRLWEMDEKYQEVVLPYFTGDDIFSAPDPMKISPRRFVIAFGSRTLEESEEFPEALKIVRERVWPIRKEARRKAHRDYWWHFGDKRPTLMRIIRERNLENFIIQTRHSKFLSPVRVPTDAIYSESTIIFPTDSAELLAVLNSSVHEIWVRETSSSLGNELRYSPTDCFNTFPLPPLKKAPMTWDKRRWGVCRALNCGLTALMNRIHDPKELNPEILKLRDLFIANDSAVLAAYGWTDLNAKREFRETPRGIRFELSESVQMEILVRLTESSNFRILYS